MNQLDMDSETSIPPLLLKSVDKIEICHFDIVNGCQLSCLGCPNSTLTPIVKRITHQDFTQCLGNIDVKHIRLFRLYNYGEPLLHKELPTLLEEIPRQRWRTDKIEISTNAQFVDWPSFEDALRTGIPNRLVVSCDGDGTPADYERLRPPSRWDRLLEFLERANELKKKYRPDLSLITRTICTSIEGRNRWQSILRPLGWEPEFRGWIMLPDAQENYSDDKTAGGLCTFLRSRKHLYVAADGTVVPCCFHPRAAELGNLKFKTFNQIMLGEERKSFSALMKDDRAAMPICSKCPAT